MKSPEEKAREYYKSAMEKAAECCDCCLYKTMEAESMIEKAFKTGHAAARDAMGISWMNKHEINESIPPAYSKFIGDIAMKILSTK
jgi:type III secretion system FlhB-like substrate exporter